MTKTELIFPAFVDFADQFSFHYKFLFHEKPFESRLTVHNFSGPITTPCIDLYRQQITSNGFFVFTKVGKGLTIAIMMKYYVQRKKAVVVAVVFLYYIKQIDSMLPCICSVIDHRGHQNVVRTSATHSVIALPTSFLFLPHFDIICDLLLNRRTATWNLLVKSIYLFKSVCLYCVCLQSVCLSSLLDDSLTIYISLADWLTPFT